MRPTRALLLLAVLAGVACGKAAPPPAVPEAPVAEEPAPPAPPPPLYERLGGKDAVTGIVDAFVSNVMADKRVSKLFAKTTGPKLDHFKEMLAAQLCEASGGGCAYTGKSMKDAHAGMKITDAQFEAILQDMSLALEEKQVAKDAAKELTDKLTALHDDIVVAAPKPAKVGP
jgi:hemoglobin